MEKLDKWIKALMNANSQFLPLPDTCFRRSIYLQLFKMKVLLTKYILFCRLILLTLVLDFSARIYSLDGIYNVGIANNKTLANFAALLCMRREDMTETRTSIWGQKSRWIDFVRFVHKKWLFLNEWKDMKENLVNKNLTLVLTIIPMIRT